MLFLMLHFKFSLPLHSPPSYQKGSTKSTVATLGYLVLGIYRICETQRELPKPYFVTSILLLGLLLGTLLLVEAGGAL